MGIKCLNSDFINWFEKDHFLVKASSLLNAQPPSTILDCPASNQTLNMLIFRYGAPTFMGLSLTCTPEQAVEIESLAQWLQLPSPVEEFHHDNVPVE